MSDTFVDESMNQPRYIFVNGNGDANHQTAINEQAIKRYRVIAVAFNADNKENGKRLNVLMEKS